MTVLQTSNRQALLLAVAFALAAFVAVVATLPDVGMTWDEPIYMESAQASAQWAGVLARSALRLQPTQAFSDDVLSEYWGQQVGEQNAPAGKVIPALTWRLFRSVLSDVNALRLGNALIFAALVGLTCLVGVQMSGAVAGAFAAASLLLMPRLFFHGHLTALDVPVAFVWLLAVWLLWRWSLQEAPRVWPAVLGMGLVYGLALATKNTSYVLPLVLLLWLLVFRRIRQAFVLLAGMVAIGALVFVVTWPWLYLDLPGNLAKFIRYFTVSHSSIVQYYLGQVYSRVPWHYPFVLVAATVPLPTLVMAIIGLVRVVAGGRRDSAGWLVVFNLVVPLLFFGFASSQVYGGERLFLVVFPFLALLAGMGFRALWQVITAGGSRAGRVLATALGVGLLLPGLLGIVSMHPYELSYYNELVGGLRGASRLGLEPTYWTETYKATLDTLNGLPEQSPSIWTEDEGVLYTYQKLGSLRQDARVGGRVTQAGPLAAGYAVIQNRPSGFTPEIEAILAERQPLFTVMKDGVALAYVFKIQANAP